MLHLLVFSMFILLRTTNKRYFFQQNFLTSCKQWLRRRAGASEMQPNIAQQKPQTVQQCRATQDNAHNFYVTNLSVVLSTYSSTDLVTFKIIPRDCMENLACMQQEHLVRVAKKLKIIPSHEKTSANRDKYRRAASHNHQRQVDRTKTAELSEDI